MSCYRIRAFPFILFCGALNAKAETPVLWPLHAKSWLTGKDSDAGRDWGQEEKQATEDEMAGWHHRLNGREFEWTLVIGDGQGCLVCCNLWGRKESDMTERLIWSDCLLNKSNLKSKILLSYLFCESFFNMSLLKGNIGTHKIMSSIALAKKK